MISLSFSNLFFHVEAGDGNNNVNDAESKSSARSSAKWSIFVYVDGDNNLEKFAFEDVNEMEKIGSDENINIVIQIDRVPGYYKTDPDWTGTRRYYVTKDDDPENINSTLLEDIGEKNMAASDTLYDFLSWGLSEYPAEHYLIVMWDHGRGIFRSGGGSSGLFRGFNEDLTSNTQEMKLWELDDIMQDLKKENGGKNFDILGFDQCWLGNLETAYELMDSVNYLTASADEEPDKGWNYEEPLRALNENPDMEPAEFAKIITEYYVKEYENKTSYDYMTQVTVDLNEINQTFLPLMNEFTEMLIKDFYEYKDILFDIRQNQMENYYHPHPDLFYFIELVESNMSLPESLRNSAAKLLSNYSKIILAEGHGAAHPNARGLAIYFPDSTAYNSYSTFQKLYEEKIDFSIERWTEFIHMFHDPVSISHDPLKDTEDTTTPYDVRVQVNGYKMDADKIGIYYSINGTKFEFKNMTLITGTDDYYVQIPEQPENTTVYYYIETYDLLGNKIYLPENAPGLALSHLNHFFVGKDRIAPVIIHSPLSNKIYSKNPFDISITVTDNIKVNGSDVRLYYRINNDDDYIEVSMMPDLKNPDKYHGTIPPQLIGTKINYHFKASDKVSEPNICYYPKNSDFQFRILGVIINIASYEGHSNDPANYTRFYDLLTAPGYNLTNINTTHQISKNTLEDMDLLVITEPDKMLSENELVTIREFIKEGGRLLIIAGSNLTIMNHLTEDFYISWEEHNEDSGYTGNYASIPAFFKNVQDLYYEHPDCKIKTGGQSYMLVKNEMDNAVLGAYTYFDQGKIVALSNGFFDSDYINAGSNHQFLNNIGNWLVKYPISVPLGPGTMVNGEAYGRIYNSSLQISEDDYIGFDGTSSVYPEWKTTSLNYTWDFGDNNISYGSNPAHQYCFNGTYTVTLTVRTYDDYTDTGEINIIVKNVQPQSYPGYIKIEDLTVYFNGSTTKDSPSDIPSLLYHWDFGDGNTGTGVSPTHTYKVKGIYYVTLTVMDDDGEMNSCTIKIDLEEKESQSLLQYITAIGAIIIVTLVLIIYAYASRKQPVVKEKRKRVGERRRVRK